MPSNDLDLTIDGVRSMIKGRADSGLIDALDKLSGIIILLSPVVLGPAALPALGLLEAKGELTKLSKEAVKAVRTGSDSLTRYELMATAYSLTCYTGFFEASDAVLTKIRRGLKIKASERIVLTAAAMERFSAGHHADGEGPGRPATDQNFFQIRLPHPTSTIDEDSRQLRGLYLELTRGFQRFVEGMEAYDSAPEHQKEKFLSMIRDLPEKAERLYREHYLNLCSDFGEFCIWANLQEHELTRQQINALGLDVQAVLRLRSEESEEVDLGLSRMAKAVEELTRRSGATPGLGVLHDLQRAYNANIREPIIRDEYDSTEEASLRYPAKADIFVPQAYRAIRYWPSDGPLEDERLWASQTVHEDLGGFILSCLSSPQSERVPLIILGHPGSGKSLLTEMLSARLADSPYTPIRVELRDINADSDIQTQIEEQLRLETGRMVSWTDVSVACADRPPLIVLDGYDELLQASGRVFSTYLMKVASFLDREAILERPVRVIVTSRITLIDKAQVPQGSTVLRLEDFNAERQRKWVQTWNECNAAYFSERGLTELVLPEQPQVQSLAQQPLLLLMLALYDSESNQLAKEQSIEQTVLYDSLLRRFIDRERRKGEQGVEFGALSHEEREREVNADMRRLGIAAVGMFNRRALNISKTDLEQDIEWFDGARVVQESQGQMLGQAELLLGSFFFVHESRSRAYSIPSDRDAEPAEGASTFEFLHNTFGEFLTADFLVRTILSECMAISSMKEQAALRDVLVQRLEGADGLPTAWFASLIFTPIFSRPVVLTMLRDWAKHQCVEQSINPRDLEDCFDDLLYSQIQRVLFSSELPSMVSGGAAHPYPDHGTLEYAAVYTVNLVLARTAVLDHFVFDSVRLDSSEGVSSWDRLSGLWKAALGLSTLDGLSRVLDSRRSDEGLDLRLRDSFGSDLVDPLQRVYGTAKCLGDGLLQGLAGWALQDCSPTVAPDLAELLSIEELTSYGVAPEVARRSELRSLNAQGLPRTRRRLADGGRWTAGPSASSVAPEAAAIDSAWANGAESSLRVLSPRSILEWPAEFGPKIWAGLGEFDHARHRLSTRQLRTLITSRASTAALMLSSDRKPGSRVMSGVRPMVLDDLREVAVQMASASRPRVPAEVAVELIATSKIGDLPPSFVSRFIGPRCNPWVAASRSKLTVERLLSVSDQIGEFGWVDRILDVLGGGDGGARGPRMIIMLGFGGGLLVLKSGQDRDQLKAHDGLSGILEWMFDHLDDDDPHVSAERVLSLLREETWGIDAGLELRDVIRRFDLTSPSHRAALSRASQQQLGDEARSI